MSAVGSGPPSSIRGPPSTATSSGPPGSGPASNQQQQAGSAQSGTPPSSSSSTQGGPPSSGAGQAAAGGRRRALLFADVTQVGLLIVSAVWSDQCLLQHVLTSRLIAQLHAVHLGFSVHGDGLQRKRHRHVCLVSECLTSSLYLLQKPTTLSQIIDSSSTAELRERLLPTSGFATASGPPLLSTLRPPPPHPFESSTACSPATRASTEVLCESSLGLMSRYLRPISLVSENLLIDGTLPCVPLGFLNGDSDLSISRNGCFTLILLISLFPGNNAPYGGAVYVANGGVLSSVSLSVFDGNGFSSAAVVGGAIYAASGSCLALVSSSQVSIRFIWSNLCFACDGRMKALPRR